MNRRSLAVLAGASALVTACYSLDITAAQENFTRERVLADPALIERVIGGTFVNFWSSVGNGNPWVNFSIFGEEIVSSNDGFTTNIGTPVRMYEYAQEPRVPFNNDFTTNSAMARDPWSGFYESNAASVEMPRQIKLQGITLIDPITKNDNTTRVLAFAKFVQGASHVYLGLIFDSAAIMSSDENLSEIPVVPFSGYKEVIDSGVKWLEEAIELTKQSTFVLPFNTSLWIYNTSVTNEELARICHTLIAKGLAGVARTPAERDSVNWARVKEHALQGVGSPFGPLGLPNPAITFDYRIAISSHATSCSGCTRSGTVRVDMRLVGPADTLGRYQAWLAKADKPGRDTVQAIIVSTPDKRIQAEGSTTPTPKPTFYKFAAEVPPGMPQERGPSFYTNYWVSSRAKEDGTQLGVQTSRANLGTILDAMYYPVELKLLIAEGEYRAGNYQAAADIINETRRQNGELPDVAGTVDGGLSGNACVPKKYNGQCGDLFDALMYEKRIETYGLGIAFFDLRGWGCLVPGTLLHLPPPGRQIDLINELEGKNRPIYTFGGQPGAPGNAGPPASRCGTIISPSYVVGS